MYLCDFWLAPHSIFISIIQITWLNCFAFSVESQLAWERFDGWEERREEKSYHRSHVSVGLAALNSILSYRIEMLIHSQFKMSACFHLFPSSCHGKKNCTKLNRQGKHLITLLCQCRSRPSSEFSTMWVGSRMHIDLVDHKQECVTTRWTAVSTPRPACPRCRPNSALIIPSCFCNLNIYRPPRQHPQSSAPHLHSDAEANRSGGGGSGVNTLCHQHLLTRSWN